VYELTKPLAAMGFEVPNAETLMCYEVLSDLQLKLVLRREWQGAFRNRLVFSDVLDAAEKRNMELSDVIAASESWQVFGISVRDDKMLSYYKGLNERQRVLMSQDLDGVGPLCASCPFVI